VTQPTRLVSAARSKAVTLIAVLLESMELIAVLLIVDILLAQQQQRPPFVDHAFSTFHFLATLLLLQYLLVATELIARHRQRQPGFTLPLVFVPFGRLLRVALLSTLGLLVLLPKLLVYFLYLTLGLVLIAPLARLTNGAVLRAIDLFDTFFEPIEGMANALHNLLHFNKIESQRTVFASVFNATLTLWCVNH